MKVVKKQVALELSLVVVSIGLTCLLYETTGFGVTVLNLFFLPVVLAGFFLGRYRAGALALLSAISVACVVMIDMSNFATFISPFAIALCLTIWGAVLGLTALLVGTLSDERGLLADEAREAHVGVVEVLSRYLQSANPHLQTRATRLAEMCEQVAHNMRLSEKEINDIRVAALLMDIENIEITSRVVRKAVGDLENDRNQATFAGTELVQSLGNVFNSAIPLLLNQAESGEVSKTGKNTEPFGAQVLRTVRAYDKLVHNGWDGAPVDPQEALEELQSDLEAEHHPAVIHALEKVVLTGGASSKADADKQEEAVVLV